MSVKMKPDFKYGRLHVRSTGGLAADTDVWVEDEDGNKIGLPVTSISLWCELGRVWSATIDTLLPRVEIDTELLEAHSYGDVIEFCEVSEPDNESRQPEGEAL